MAFEKRTWLARIGQGLNKFIIGAKDGEGKQTLTNSPDSVTQQGDVISAENLNDLEDRIADGFDEKQDVLTFDDEPTQNSSNPAKSGGIFSYTERNLGNAVVIRSISDYVDSIAVPSGANNHAVTIPTVTGYSPIGIVEWGVTLDAPSKVRKWYSVNAVVMASGVVRFYFCNIETSQVTQVSGTFSARVLYVKNTT